MAEAKFDPRKEERDFNAAQEVGAMHVVHSDRYKLPCVVAYWGESAQEIIDYCRQVGAVWPGGASDGSDLFVIAPTALQGPGLITEKALRKGRGQGGESGVQ